MKFATRLANKFNVDTKVFETNDLKDLVELEHQVLNFWERLDLQNKLLTKNLGKPKFSFFDGPLTANNQLGVHHAWGRTYKDTVQRYKSMKGFDQRFQNGFDTQGLWVEVEVEKSLRLGSKRDIETYGLENFAQASKDRVKKFSEIQTNQSKRFGQAMDWDNSYSTHTDDNVSAIWHFLKVCHEKGWLYKAKKPMPWCSRCGTSLSNHEQADSYKIVTHESPYVKFPVMSEDFSLLVWTTTPWTLPANMAVAVHPDLDYCKYKTPEGELLVAGSWLKETVLKHCKVVEKFKGAVLERLEYMDPFPELSVREDVPHYVYLWDEVTENEGSGMIHVAPGCGYDDYEFSVKYNLKALAPLNEDGVYSKGYGTFSGQHYSVVNKMVIQDLKSKNLVVTTENYEHRYPHCWRCKEELVFRLVEEWFISTDEVRPLMQEAAKTVDWKPKYVGKLFDDWLRNMQDWCISRKRYWGLPLPFYECNCGHLTVVGSKKDFLKRAVGDTSKVKELHRPWVDKVQVSCESCGSPVDRVLEVGDCWLDAGVMPFSTLQYFDNKEYWNEWFPADFACEMREQTRLWFYATMFMAVTLEGRSPFKTVVSYEKVQDKDNKPMHKSTGNAVWFDDAVEKFGADTLRLMYLAQNQSTNMKFNLEEESSYSRPLLLLWNVLKFFTSLADLSNYKYSEQNQELSHLDKWMYSELDSTVSKFNELLDDYQFMKLQQTLVKFMDNLSSWYVRRSRRRFWADDDGNEDKQQALNTLFDILLTVSKLLAPLTPFMSEVVYQSLRHYNDSLNEDSVHLTNYPTSQDLYDSKLRDEVNRVRKFVSLGLKLRSTNGLRVRQPLARLVVWSKDPTTHSLLSKYMSDLLTELNVKKVEVVNDVDSYLFYMLKPRYDVLGPKLGDRTKTLVEELSLIPQEEVLSLVHSTNGNYVRLKDGLELTLRELEVNFVTTNGYSALVEDDLVLLLKTKLTKPLYDQGFVRDFVRHVQTARRDLELKLDDKVSVRVNAPKEVWLVLTSNQDYVWNETQMTSWKNLNSTYFDLDDPEVKRLSYKNGNKQLEVLFTLTTEEQLIEA